MSNVEVSAETQEVSRERGQPRLRAFAIALILTALLGAVYWKILGALVTQWWDDPNYSHGLLVPLFSLYLVWQQRAVLRTLPRRGRVGNRTGLIGPDGRLQAGTERPGH